MSSTDHAPMSPARLRRRYVAALASGLLLAAGVVSAAAPATASVPVRVLDVMANDNCDQFPCGDSFDLSSDHLTAGLIDVRLHNVGHVDHQVQFMRLHDGIDPGFYLDSISHNGGATALVFADAMGGSNAVVPGASQETWVNLPAGTYVALCFQDGPGGPPHFVLGMHAIFTVTGQGNSAHPPAYVRGTISAFTSVTTSGETLGFHLPAVIDGHGIYRFVNTAATDTHELTLLKLKTGMHKADVLAWLTAPVGQPPFSSAGGNGALAPGGQAWVRLNLSPGDYVAACFVPDNEAPHLPHSELGMIDEFHVAG